MRGRRHLRGIIQRGSTGGALVSSIYMGSINVHGEAASGVHAVFFTTGYG